LPLKLVSLGERSVLILYQKQKLCDVIIVDGKREVRFKLITISSQMKSRNIDATAFNDVSLNKNGPLVGVFYDENKIDVFMG
jgi:hypothetical protein